MSIRLRRLQAEYERLSAFFSGQGRIRIEQAIGRPPDRYIVEYRVPGLVEEKGGIQRRDLHRAQITLGSDYPRQRPRCVMLTPVFHPNIDHLAICTEDIGSVGQTLDQTIVFIGEMIAFQAYNLQSPRNGEAARWTAEHIDQLPLESVDLMPTALTEGYLPDVRPTLQHTDELKECENCGCRDPQMLMERCSGSHHVCKDCHVPCANCAAEICILCIRSCQSCTDAFCPDCIVECRICQSAHCLAHIDKCSGCGSWHCSDCIQECRQPLASSREALAGS